MERLMELLGHPERRLKFIHVAGTNGKGSTCTYLSEIIHKCGYDVGLFTSPYIERYSNRIKYNGKDIPDNDLLDMVNLLKPVVDEVAASDYGQPTMFEVSTALAIVYFAKRSFPDYVVWETGLGGRLDSTNIVAPVATVITNVGHDHMEILGDTLAKVAEEKAGIIKNGVPVITAVEQPEAFEVIQRIAKERKSTLYKLDREFSFNLLSSRENEQKFDFTGPFRTVPGVTISLNGYHQNKNAAVALMTIEVLRQYYALIVEDEDLLEGFRAAAWPGRLEIVSEQPRILIDGAHNPEGAETLAQALRDVYPYRKLHFMMGMLSTKNHTGYLRHILPMVNTLILTEPDWHKKESAARLADLARTLLEELGPERAREVEVIVEPEWKKALELLRTRTEKEDLAVVSGTLYLIGDVRSWILNQSDSEKGW
ncbi:bifunctional folylpolyglutamate synthase/dihydrofolate synthase [Paenibacillus thalictri]|uniref:tetrahydrofolate synthase n=2 Tax=Paenibacillus thalictri TaxID=2527873 RepID=A0A4Q9E0B4_9BACL|nr:bifunctional folylpolyglutamate synthase/dihydrofolate synthase [Paenibacillus thalictri]